MPEILHLCKQALVEGHINFAWMILLLQCFSRMFRTIMYRPTLVPDKHALYTIWLPSIRANGIIYPMSILHTLRLLEIPLFLTNLPVWKDMVYALLTQI